MKSTLYNILQRQGLRFCMAVTAVSLSTLAFAQDDLDDDAPAIKAPKRTVVADKYPTVTVKGIVVDNATNNPLAGVRIHALNDNRYAAMTNAKGEFTIKVPTFATALFVQAPHYINQQVAINNNDSEQNVSITMLSDKFGAMYEEATDLAAKNNFVSDGKTLTIDEEIGMKLGADIHTTMHSGQLETGAMMLIRGINSINLNSQPLVILDGVELDMQRDRGSLHQGDIFNMLSTISPEDIDKVTVVKNATALYGARGANGVILIETKRGHSMATRIDANIGAGWTFIPSTPTMMNAAQYSNYAMEMLGTIPEVQNRIGSTTNPLVFHFGYTNNDYYGPTYSNDTDWKDEVFKAALTHNYSINVQGGDDIGMYNLSVAYIQTMKNVKRTSFDRVNVRFNTDISLLEKLKTKFDMSFSRYNSNILDDGIPADLNAGTITSPTFLALIKAPVLNPYRWNWDNYEARQGHFTTLLSDADELYGTLTSGNFSLANPTAVIANGSGERKNRNENTFFNVAIAPTYEINPHLSVTSHFSYYLNRKSQAYYRPNIGLPSFTIAGLGTVYSMTGSIFSKETNIISNTHLDWANKYGAHDIAVTGGFRYNSFAYDDSDLSTQYDTKGDTDKNPELGVGNNVFASIEGADDIWKNMQWYANAEYSYMNKYFVQASLLAEANSRFGKEAKGSLKAFGTRWAIFPSLQMGWVLTNEKWFPKNVGINYLKINAGFDISGNDNVPINASRTFYSTIRYNNNEIGLKLGNVGNEQIKWETTTKWNAGFQANMLNNRLSVAFDYYVHNTKDLLALKTFTNPIGGINNYWTNDGKVRNTGFEAKVSGKPVNTKDWKLEVGASVGHYDNKVIALADGAYTSSLFGDKNILTAEGNPVGVFYGYKTNGIFSTSAQAAAAGLKFKDETGADVAFEAGDVCFVDQNGDGYINEADKTVIGNPNPDIYGNIFASLKWKRFALDMIVNYSLGNDVYNYQKSIINAGSNLYNQQISETGHWRYEGQNATLPKLAYGDPHNNNRFSDRWIEDGSYLRMKSVKLSYQIAVPEAWTSWLQGVSVWVEGRNLFTLTRYTGNDPEFSLSNNHMYQGIDCGNIAQGRMFNMGVKINL